jgi:hypothetical protein
LIYTPTVGEPAVTESNIFTDIDKSRESLDHDLTKLPPCTIARFKRSPSVMWNIYVAVPIPFLVMLNGTPIGATSTETR